MRGRTRVRNRGKQPKPYWRWKPESRDSKRGWWVHPMVGGVVRAAAFGLAFGLGPGLVKGMLHFFFGDDIVGAVKAVASDVLDTFKV